MTTSIKAMPLTHFLYFLTEATLEINTVITSSSNRKNKAIAPSYDKKNITTSNQGRFSITRIVGIKK